MNHLYCYKMTWVTEFAPNPFNGVLTLANCKPTIRRGAKVGDWISGWTAKTVTDANHCRHSFCDGQNLVYLAKIDQIIPIAEYWVRFPEKRPHLLPGTADKYDKGDNIYQPKFSGAAEAGEFIQLDNFDHKKEEIKHDISGKNVLICKEFYYFGLENLIAVDSETFPYTVPRCKKIPLSEVENFIESIKSSKTPRIQ